jgi:hypothetical protein
MVEIQLLLFLKLVWLNGMMIYDIILWKHLSGWVNILVNEQREEYLLNIQKNSTITQLLSHFPMMNSVK